MTGFPLTIVGDHNGRLWTAGVLSDSPSCDGEAVLLKQVQEAGVRSNIKIVQKILGESSGEMLLKVLQRAGLE